MSRAARVGLALACAIGCGSPPPTEGPTTATGPGSARGPVVEPPRCATLPGPGGPADRFTADGASWVLADGVLTRNAGAGPIAIGVVGDAAEAAPPTIAALTRLRARLIGARVSVVLALGGMGTSREDLAATLGALARGAPWPVVALAGDLERAQDHAAAIAELRGEGLAIVDARAARWIALPGVTIGTVPGGGAVERLVPAADGCAVTDADVTAIATALAARPGLRVAASAEAPRELRDGAPTGELRWPAAQAVDVILHGERDTPSEPARGARDGAAVALGPGPADAARRLGPHGPTRPAAGVLTVTDNAWSWAVLSDAR